MRLTYAKTLLGWPWLFIRALFPVIIATFVFHELAGIESGPVPYFLFYLIGSAIWNLFEEALMWATRSIQINRRLVAKLYLPRMILPLATMAPALVDFAIHLALIVGAVVFFAITDGRWFVVFGPGLFQAAGAVLSLLLLTIGLGLFTSVLGAEHRDLRFSLRYIFRFWFFLTPVVYPLSAVPQQWRWAIALNPVAVPVDVFRSGLLGMPNEVSGLQIGLSGLTLVLALVLGLKFFMSAEAAAVDRV